MSIKESISKRGKGDIFVGFEETLLSELEKAQGESIGLRHMVSEYQASCKRWEEIVEKGKEQSDYFRLEVNRLTDELAKEKERAERLEKSEAFVTRNLFFAQERASKAEERVKELERGITRNPLYVELESRLKDSEAKNQIYLQDIKNEQGLSTEINERLKKLVEEHKCWSKILGHIFVRALQKDYEALEIYAKYMKIEMKDGEPSAESKALGEVKDDFKDYTSLNLLVEQLSERIKELEAQLASSRPIPRSANLR